LSFIVLCPPKDSLAPDCGWLVATCLSIISKNTTVVHSSDVVYMAGVYFACVMILCTVSVSMAVLVLNLHNRSPDAYTMPTVVR